MPGTACIAAFRLSAHVIAASYTIRGAIVRRPRRFCHSGTRADCVVWPSRRGLRLQAMRRGGELNFGFDAGLLTDEVVDGGVAG